MLGWSRMWSVHSADSQIARGSLKRPPSRTSLMAQARSQQRPVLTDTVVRLLVKGRNVTPSCAWGAGLWRQAQRAGRSTTDMEGSPRYTVPCAPRPTSSYTWKPWRSAAASVPSSALDGWHEHRLPAHTQRSGRPTSNRQRRPPKLSDAQQAAVSITAVRRGAAEQYLCRSGPRQRASAAWLQQAGRRKGLQRGERPPRPALSAARALSGWSAALG